MARPWRIEFEGALYHVLSRGNEQKDIFWESEDRESFLSCLGEMSARFDTDIFAYVLMDNHYHTAQDQPCQFVQGHAMVGGDLHAAI